MQSWPFKNRQKKIKWWKMIPNRFPYTAKVSFITAIQKKTNGTFPKQKKISVDPATSREAMQGMSIVGCLWIEIRVLFKQILISQRLKKMTILTSPTKNMKKFIQMYARKPVALSMLYCWRKQETNLGHFKSTKLFQTLSFFYIL